MMIFAKTNRRRLVVLLAAAGVLGVATIALRLANSADLTGGTPAERAASIGRLADEQPWGASSVIAAAAANEADQEVRRAAVIALRKFAADRRKTVEASTRDRSARVRAAAACTLGKLTDKAATRRLGEMLNDSDEDDSVRAAAASALAGNKTPQATVLLVRAMESHPKAEVRDYATAALIHNSGLLRIKANPRAVAEYRKKNRAEWADLVETIKMIPATQAAFAKLNQPLAMHPENLVHRPNKHICHPEDKTLGRIHGREPK